MRQMRESFSKIEEGCSAGRRRSFLHVAMHLFRKKTGHGGIASTAATQTPRHLGQETPQTPADRRRGNGLGREGMLRRVIG